MCYVPFDLSYVYFCQTWQVEMFDMKMRSLNVAHLQSKLKDIYFPYIQVCEISDSLVYVLVRMCSFKYEVR